MMMGKVARPYSMNTTVATIPDFPYALPFEKNFDREVNKKWLHDSYSLCLYYGAGYLVSVALGKVYMKNRPPYDLRWAMVIWNTALAAMSIGGTLRSVPELIHVIRHFGFSYSLCSLSYYNDSPITATWVYVFVVSKLFELLDTWFIIFRKQKLTFLHWFHHCSVLVFTWTLFNDQIGTGRWFISMNYTVHSLMYTYFALRALRVPIPRKIAMVVTVFQILQMFAGFYISVRSLGKWFYQEPGCAISSRCAFFSVFLYSFYMYLFIQFFVQSYFKKQLHRSHGEKKGN